MLRTFGNLSKASLQARRPFCLRITSQCRLGRGQHVRKEGLFPERNTIFITFFHEGSSRQPSWVGHLSSSQASGEFPQDQSLQGPRPMEPNPQLDEGRLRPGEAGKDLPRVSRGVRRPLPQSRGLRDTLGSHPAMHCLS